MQFESWSAFWNMGGYSFYVWLSFGASVAVLVWMVIDSLWQKRKLFTLVEQEAARKARIQAARERQHQQDQTGVSQ